MKTLVIDIETKPPLLYAWPPLYDLHAGVEQVQERGQMICFAAKWVGQKRTLFYSERKHGLDRMVEEANRLLDEADLVVTFNGQTFDEKHINWEIQLLMQRQRDAGEEPLELYSPFERWDLKKIGSKYFRPDSGKLAYYSRFLEIGEKLKHEGWDMWQGWIDGDPYFIRKMERYNRKDVILTEQLMDELEPWLPIRISTVLEDRFSSTPGPDVCPACGSRQREKRGYHYTKVSKYQRYRCLDCGRYYRSNSRIAGASTQTVGR